MSLEVILGSFTFFATIRVLFTRLPLPETVHHKWRWFNVWISWIHALFITSGCMYCLISDPKLLNSLQHYDCGLAYNLVAASIGYFVYDAMDIAIYVPFSQSRILLCHHFVVILCFSVVVATGNHVPIAIICLLVEINSVFLHARQILRTVKIQDGPVYTVNKIINIITFFIFRFVTLSWMLRRILLQRTEIRISYFILLTVCFPLMIFINFGLFLQVLLKDVPAMIFLQKLQDAWSARAGDPIKKRGRNRSTGTLQTNGNCPRVNNPAKAKSE